MVDSDCDIVHNGVHLLHEDGHQESDTNSGNNGNLGENVESECYGREMER